MNINLNKIDENKLNKLLFIKEANIQVAEMLNELCLNREEDFLSLTRNAKTNNELKEVCLSYLGVDKNDKDNKFIIDNWLNCFFLIDDRDFIDNPYYKNIKSIQLKDNNYQFKIDIFESGTLFPLDDIEIKDEYLEQSKIARFNKDYSFLSLYKNDEIWISITPNEINTMKPYIDKCHGNVITFGLGLGYFAYMASLKREVNHVYVIEKDEKVIELYNQNLKKYFNEKVIVIKDDAINYIKHNDLDNFDYCFFDIWHDANDGLPIYLEIKKILKEKRKVNYWLEESLIALYRRCLLTVIEEQYNGLKEENYRKAKTKIDKIINDIYFKTKQIKITSYEQIIKLCSKQSLLNLISK